MLTRSLFVVIAVLFVSGCATTQQANQPITALQTKVADLETRMEEQEKEIVDLKYEVKSASEKTETKAVIPLEESSYSAPAVKTSTKSGGAFADILKVSGVTGEELQKALKGAGLYDGKIDGKVGAKTKAAVVEFQKSHNLKADGVVGQKTWNELKQYLSE